MTQQQREEMAAVFRGMMPQFEEIEQMIAADIKKLEPLIDRWIKEAEIRGWRGTMDETWTPF